MTLETPLWEQNASYPSQRDRQMVEILPAVGVLGDTDLKVSQRAAGANMSVDIAVGSVVVQSATASRGRYLCRSTAIENRVVPASPGAGSSRWDLIIAEVTDTEYGDGTNAWSLSVFSGTAAGAPVQPATPAGAVLLAAIYVGSGVAMISNINIGDSRPYARPVTYSNRLPATAADGQMVMTSGAVLYLRAGAAWVSTPNATAFASVGSTMASTSLPVSGAHAIATLSSSAPVSTNGVNITVAFYGSVTAGAGVTDAIVEVDAQISTNGSTYTAGETIRALSVNELAPVAIAAGKTFSGVTPTGSVKIRVYATRIIGASTMSGHLVATMTPA